MRPLRQPATRVRLRQRKKIGPGAAAMAKPKAQPRSRTLDTRTSHGRQLYWLGLSEKGNRLSRLDVLLQPADDPAPRVVHRGELGWRDRGRPAGVAEPDLLTALLGGDDLPRNGGAFPPRKTAGARPAHQLAWLELVHLQLERRTAEAEPGDRPDLGFRVAVFGPEPCQPLPCGDGFVDLAWVTFDG